MAALVVAAALAAGTAACSHSDSSKGKPGAAGTAASRPSRDPSLKPGDPGPCRVAMNELMDAGSKIVAAPGDKAKTADALAGVSTRLGAAAAKIGDPAAKQGAQDLAALYGKLAQETKDGAAPDVKDLQGKVATATAALGKCSGAEG